MTDHTQPPPLNIDDHLKRRPEHIWMVHPNSLMQSPKEWDEKVHLFYNTDTALAFLESHKGWMVRRVKMDG